MSARREKRLRKLEARIAYLESRVYSVEKRQLTLDADYEPVPVVESHQSRWHRFVDAFRWRHRDEH